MSFFSARLALVGLVVFLANAGLLVLQLISGRLLAPFVGSSLETWTSIIAAFLIGIALGNAVGGRIADRSPRPGKLAQFLFLGVLASFWMIGFPELLKLSSAYTSIPLTARIPLLSLALCLPVAFVLSLLTPLAIRIGVSAVEGPGRVSGMVFALSTLGCLLGNYLTGFVLIPEFTINTIVLAVAGLLGVTAFGTILVSSSSPTAPFLPADSNSSFRTSLVPALLSLRSGFAIVFLCSFAGMTLELAATRLLAQVFGVSIYTWTGVIGVMLFGTACGNALGGWLADKSSYNPDPGSRSVKLGWTLIIAGVLAVVVIAVFAVFSQSEELSKKALVPQILIYTFGIFFLPMLLLGMVSPQVIRLCVSDVNQAGRTAGRIYAVSTLGAILGTFAAGYVLISSLGVHYTILLAGLFPCLAMLFLSSGTSNKRLVLESSAMLYAMSAAMGAVLGGFILKTSLSKNITAETNYYTIRVDEKDYEVVPSTEELGAVIGHWAVQPKMQKVHGYQSLYLDHLLHSKVDLDDPKFLFYHHEILQTELLWPTMAEHPKEQNVLVIGGGGYTFPRFVRTQMPSANVDVVEIDPGVTKVAIEKLGLKPEWGVRSFNMDGRQFVAEKAKAGHYHLATLDAVNDLSVPSHLLTKECNDAVKRTLTVDGVYLVTVIDLVENGLLWKAAFETLKKSFTHVELLYPKSDFFRAMDIQSQNLERHATTAETLQLLGQAVLVIYASDRPLNLKALNEVVREKTRKPTEVFAVPQKEVDELLAKTKSVILTDQYAPTDDLMRQVFNKRKPKEE